MSERLIVDSRVSATITIRLTEDELRALHAIAAYGTDAFLSMFYVKMGRAYLEPHETGLRTLFAALSSETPQVTRCIDEARAAFKTPAKAAREGGGA